VSIGGHPGRKTTSRVPRGDRAEATMISRGACELKTEVWLT
jgi:hypothetical protein